MLVMLVVGKLLERKVDPRLLILLGLALTAFSLWEMTLINLSITQWIIVKTGFIQGIGLGFTFVPLTTIAFSTLNPAYRVEATGLFTLFRNIGSSIGVSIVSTLLSRNIQINHANLSPATNIFNYHSTTNIISQATHGRVSEEIVGAVIDSMINMQAQMIAYIDCFQMMMMIVIASMPLVFLLSFTSAGAKDASASDPAFVH